MSASNSTRHLGRVAFSSAFLLVAGASGFAYAADPAVTTPAAQEQAKQADELPTAKPKGNKIVDDHSGRKQEGKASIYSDSFAGKPMADGNRYNPKADVAASKTLPLGTVAKVTNLETGKSTEVTVQDRGPFVSGRVVDLTPKTAAKLGLTEKEGLAPVVVAPIKVPQPDGSVKAGAGAKGLAPAASEEAENSPQEGARQGGRAQ
jgi:rare lipoprotein A